MGMPDLFVPVGDPQFNRNPRLSSGGYWGQTLYLGVTPLSKSCPLGWVPEKEVGSGQVPHFPLISSSFGIWIICHLQDLRSVLV